MSVEIPAWLEAVRVLFASGPNFDENKEFEVSFAKVLSPETDFPAVYRRFIPFLYRNYILPLGKTEEVTFVALKVIQGLETDWQESIANLGLTDSCKEIYRCIEVASKACMSNLTTFVDYPTDLINESAEAAAKLATKHRRDSQDSAERYDISQAALENAYQEMATYLLGTLYRAAKVS